MPTLGPFPYSPHSQSRGRAMEVLWRRYEALPKTPLRIRAKLLTPYVGAEGERVHLDGLLSYGLVESLPYPLHYGAPACVLPLPLALLDVLDGPNGERLPLWAAGDLIPRGRTLRGREYWHKRYPADRAELGRRMRADLTAGRYKEYRVPLATVQAEELVAVAIGHPIEVRRLLEPVLYVGKKRAQGFGRVARWEVEPLPLDEALAIQAVRSTRPIPADDGVMMGFTPPYWYAPWHRPCARPYDPA